MHKKNFLRDFTELKGPIPSTVPFYIVTQKPVMPKLVNWAIRLCIL